MRDNVVALFLTSFITVTSAICYYPNGDASPQDLPCRDDTDHSTCCGPGYACLTNNICIPTGIERQLPNAAKFVRGSCTDKTWRSSLCPNFCVNAEHGDTLDGGIGIAKCPGPKDMYYCMDGWPFDCTTGENVLSFQGTPSVVTTIGVAKTSVTPTATATPTTPSTSKTPTPSTPSPLPSSSSSIPSSSSSTTLSSSTFDAPASSAPSTTAAAPVNSTLPPASVNQTSSSPSIALIAGLAAGISVGVIGLAAAAFMAHRRYQTKKREARQPPPRPPSMPSFGHPKAELYSETEYKKQYDPAIYSYSRPDVVYELAVERIRTPELPAGRQF